MLRFLKRPLRRDTNFRSRVLLVAIGVLIFAGGSFLVLLASGLIVIGEPSFINDVLGAGSTKSILSLVGVGLIASAVWVPGFVERIQNKKQAIKIATSHHVRNRIQEALLILELLKEEGPLTEGQRKLIEQAEAGCEELVNSLTKIVASDGEKIDYSLAMKKHGEKVH